MPKGYVQNFNIRGDDEGIPESTDFVAPASAAPAAAFLPPPENVVASAGPLAYSSATPRAYLNVTWDEPIGAVPESYQISYANDAAFTAEEISTTTLLSASIALPCGRTYYVRVRSVVAGNYGEWSDTASATTAADTTPPAAPTSPAAVFTDGGDLVVTWTNATSTNLRDVEIGIYDSASKTVLYAQIFEATGRCVWPAAQNRAAASGSPDPSLYIELRSRSWGNVFSSVVSASATKVPPAAPTVTVTWDGAAGVAKWSWSAVSDAAAYRLTIDSKVYQVGDLSYAYSAAQNRLDHGGTASASLPWSLVAVDALDQVSAVPASGTATLARPATPAGVVVSWDSALGTARWTWTPAAGVAYALLTIDGTARQVLDSRYDYLVAQNRLEHSGSADPSLAWSLAFVDGLGQTSTTSASGTATLDPPETPTGIMHTWSGDAGTAGPDWTIAWAAVSTPIASYRLTIDGVARTVVDLRYTYPIATNRQEHSGSADPALTWSLVAVDGLGQVSTTPASGTATNAAPAAPTISAAGGFSTIGVNITSVAPPDLDYYQVQVITGGSTVATFTTRDVVAVWQATTAGQASYSVGVRAYDLFGQAGIETFSSSFVLDVVTQSELRAGVSYTDSASTNATTLAGLKDDDRATNVVTYAAGTSWKWTLAQRVLPERCQNITVAASGGTGYIGMSPDGSTWRWYSGPLGSDGRTLTYIGSGVTGGAEELSAQAAALSLPSNDVWALPGLVEGRYVRLGHRNTGGTYSLREFYPPSMVIADQIRADSITARHIVSASITGDRIFGTDLAAIKANLGSVTISGICSIGAAGGIYQGSAGTFAAPDTGLKIYSSSGMGLWESWGGGVKQSYLSTDGALYAGAGNVRLSSSGLRLVPYNNNVGFDATSYVGWLPSGASSITSWVGSEYTPSTGVAGSGKNAVYISAQPLTTGNIPYETSIQLQASSVTGVGGVGAGTATIKLVSQRPTGSPNNPYVQIGASASVIDAASGDFMLKVFKSGVLVNNSSSSATPRQALDVAGSGILDGALSVGTTVSSTGNGAFNGVSAGVHTGYTTGGRVSLWKTGGTEYFIQTDGTDTQLNAPVSGGAVYIRGANSLRATFDSAANFISSNDVRSVGNVIAGSQTAPPVSGRINSVVANLKATNAYNAGLVLTSNDPSQPFVLVAALQTDPSGVNRYAAIDVDDNGTKRALKLQPFGGPVQIGNSLSLFGIFGATPVGQQTGGAATAGTTWTTTERDMLNRVYAAIRAFGFMS